MAALGTQHFPVSDEVESKSRLAESGSADLFGSRKKRFFDDTFWNVTYDSQSPESVASLGLYCRFEGCIFKWGFCAVVVPMKLLP